MSRVVLVFLFSFLLVPDFSAQKNDVQTLNALARQAKDNGETKKAISYFEELLAKTNSDSYYSELYGLYIKDFNFETADKMVKKRIRRYPKRAELLVDRANLYEVQNELKVAEKYYNQAVSAADKNQNQVRIVANRLSKYKRFNYVEEIYLKARKTQRNERLYQFELANAYAQQGKTNEMVGEYLNILGSNKGYLQTVQNILQRVLSIDPENVQKDKLKDQLLRKIQKNPSQEIYSELLVWLYIQDKNFNGAFIQAKALDRKSNENGKKLYNLAQLCLANKEYKVAEKSFRYVINLGDKSPYYLRAKMRLVDVLKEKVTQRNDYTLEDLLNLKVTYEKTIQELGKSSITLPMLRGLAELNAYYLDSIDTGIEILDDAIKLGGIRKQDKAMTKIELADLYLLSDEVWEASLLYSQVEKEFKYDRIGEIAKFKNAKIAFYIVCY